MKFLHITALYTTILAALTLYNGCGDSMESGPKREATASKGSSQAADPGADDPNKPTELSEVPTEVAEWPVPLRRIRDKMAREHCIANAGIQQALEDLECRVMEQKRWLDNTFLYSDGGDSSEEACVTQGKRLETEVLKFEQDSAGQGAKWLEKACKAATDRVMEKMGARTKYEQDDSELPAEARVAAELKKVLEAGEEESFELEEADDDDDEDPSYNLEMMTRFSLYRLNHNCAHYMDTKVFPEKITPAHRKGDVRAFYVFRQFRDQGDSVFQALYPVLDVYQQWSADPIADTKIQDFREGGYIDFNATREALPGSAKIIAIRRIALTCEGGKRPYERHAKHDGSGGSARTTLFDLSPRFDVAFLDSDHSQCEGTDKTLRRVMPAPRSFATGAPEQQQEQTALGWKCKAVFDDAALTASSVASVDLMAARAVECHSRTVSPTDCKAYLAGHEGTTGRQLFAPDDDSQTGDDHNRQFSVEGSESKPCGTGSGKTGVNCNAVGSAGSAIAFYRNNYCDKGSLRLWDWYHDHNVGAGDRNSTPEPPADAFAVDPIAGRNSGDDIDRLKKHFDDDRGNNGDSPQRHLGVGERNDVDNSACHGRAPANKKACVVVFLPPTGSETSPGFSKVKKLKDAIEALPSLGATDALSQCRNSTGPTDTENHFRQFHLCNRNGNLHRLFDGSVDNGFVHEMSNTVAFPRGSFDRDGYIAAYAKYCLRPGT